MSNLALFPANLSDDVERPDGVREKWVRVTPHWAMKVLQQYDDFSREHPDRKMNRNVSQAHVQKLASDMRNGMWSRTHQGLAFDAEGVLLDGQHRLWAVVESDTTQMMHVMTGLDRREAQPAIDTHRGRTLVDACTIAGFTGMRTLHAAVMKAMVRGASPTKPVMTRIEEMQEMQRHKKAIEFALELFPGKRMAGIMRAPVLAVIARASYTLEFRERLKRFAEVLATGQRHGDEEAVIVMLNQWLLTNKADGSATSLEAYAKTTRALQAYLKGERIRTLYGRKDDGAFPMPTLRKSSKDA